MEAPHCSTINSETQRIQRHNTALNGIFSTPLPRFAISPCTDLQNNRNNSNIQQFTMTRRATVGGDEHSIYFNNNLLGNNLTGRETVAELSPVDENVSINTSTNNMSGLLATTYPNRSNIPLTSTSISNNQGKISTLGEKKSSNEVVS